ncbi:MAG: transposase [Deltaproteobacteria bacterium]|nr:transposase [Deltaproteobacteria bacterium]
MYKENHSHLQIPLTSHVDELPENLRKRLKKSWASTFYREFFCRLDEGTFEVLYANIPSRPNVPVNVLVGLEYLKAGNGWTDEEMYDNFCYDVQVRYALGYRQLGEGYFDLRTVYYFRERLSRHMQETGMNLLDQAFEQVTDEQLAAFEIKTGKQRMDSTQVASNIRQMGRVQLLVEVLQRIYRMLSEADRARYAEVFLPYLKGHAGQYVYRMKREEIGSHLQQTGELMQRLLVELKPAYVTEAIYQVLERVLGDHFQMKGTAVEARPNDDLSATSLQSPDDLEATYREKRGQSYQGYVANVTETCDPENKLQLITKVQVAPNATDDGQLLVEALPNLKERNDLKTIFTDGGHAGPTADTVLQQQGVEQVQTAIRGRNPNPDKLHLSDFLIRFDEDGKPFEATCPQGQTVGLQPSLQKKAFVAHFAAEACAACSLADKCPARPGKRDPRHHLGFTQAEAQVATRRRRSREHLQEGRNLRAAVEATVRSLKHPFRAGKLPVRGQFRVACLLIGSAAVANIRRIQRYLEAENEEQNQPESIICGQSSTPQAARDSLLVLFGDILQRQVSPDWAFSA